MITTLIWETASSMRAMMTMEVRILMVRIMEGAKEKTSINILIQLMTLGIYQLIMYLSILNL